MNTKKQKGMLPPREFAKRVLTYTFYSLLLLLISIGIGIIGYHYFGNLDYLDSIYNASMILTGMGPVNEMKTESDKLFSSFYALFSGVIFLNTVAIFYAPIAHRLMHIFCMEELEE